MTVPKALQVRIVLPIDPPHPFIAALTWLPQLLATHVRWERTITEERDTTCATVFTEGGMYRYRSSWTDGEIPAWVPRPPASWDAIVSDLAAELLP